MLAQSGDLKRHRNEDAMEGTPAHTSIPPSREVRMMDVSAVIVNWNTRDLLLKCIASLLRFTHSASIEIIVVDNASTDGSVDAVKRDCPSVHVICNDANLGFSKANTSGSAPAPGAMCA